MGKSGKMLGFLVKGSTWSSRWVINRELGEEGRSKKKAQFNFVLEMSNGQLKTHIWENSEPQQI